MGCTFCGLCKAQKSQTRAQSQTPLSQHQTAVIGMIKTFKVEKKVHQQKSFEEFKKQLIGLVQSYYPDDSEVTPTSYDTTTTMSRSKREILAYIKKDLSDKKGRHIINQFKCAYHDFLMKFFNFTEDQESKTDGWSISLDRASEINQTPPLRHLQSYQSNNYNNSSDYQDLHYHRKHHSHEGLQNKVITQFEQYPGLATVILNQCNLMMTVMRYLLNVYYHNDLDLQYGDPDLLPDREMTIQNVIQGLIFRRGDPLDRLFESAIIHHYQEYDSTSRNDGSRQGTTFIPYLDKSLMPRSEIGSVAFNESSDNSFENSYNNTKPNNKNMIFDIIEEKDEEIDTPQILQQKQEKENIQSPLVLNTSEKYGEPLRQRVLNFIRQSEINAIDHQIPYGQTFPLILRLVEERKLWKKYTLTNRVDALIVQIFLLRRSTSQYGQLYDTITAADSKAEILLFILYKFSLSNPQIDLQKKLYLPLRFMYDFDGPLLDEVKNVFNPSFVRFFSMLDMYMNCDLTHHQKILPLY